MNHPVIPTSEAAGSTRDRDEIFATINSLVATCIDGQRMFAYAAGDVIDRGLAPILTQYARQRGEFTRELQSAVARMGGKPAHRGSVVGTLLESWMEVKAAAAVRENRAILQELEREEDITKGRYAKALRKALPPQLRSVIQRQATAVRQVHDHVRLLRGN